MNQYDGSSRSLDTSHFSANQIRALSNGIGIGQTRQRRLNIQANPNASHPMPQNIHQTAYAAFTQEQSVPFRQKSSTLYAINRFFAAVMLDAILLMSILGGGAFVAFVAIDGMNEWSVAALKASLQSFTSMTKSLTSSLKLAEIALIPATILLVYYLGLSLLLGGSIGFSIFRKKRKIA